MNLCNYLLFPFTDAVRKEMIPHILPRVMNSIQPEEQEWYLYQDIALIMDDSRL